MTGIAERIREMSLVSLLQERATRQPDERYFTFEDQAYSYSEVWRWSRHYAAALANVVDAGERVVLLLNNGPRFFYAFFGIQLAGGVPVPLSPKLGAGRVGLIVADSGAAAILSEERLVSDVRGPSRVSRYARGKLLFCNELESSQAADVPALGAAVQSVRPSDAAFVQYTSGSTGASKGVVISHRAALANIDAFGTAMELGQHEQDVASSMMPLFHDMGLLAFGLAPLYWKIPLILYHQEALSLYHWLSGIARHRVSVTGCPNTFLNLANRYVRDPARFDLSSLRTLICGSEPIMADVVRSFEQRYGLSEVVRPAYGMAEVALCATLTRPKDVLRVHEGRVVACGTAIPGVDVKIRNDAGGLTCEPFLQGEIVIRSPSLMDGYLGAEADTLAAVEDGYLRSGDEGFLDAEGRLYVVGRRKNLIIRAGEKFAPSDLEALALQCEGVEASAVVGVEEAGGATEVVLVLELNGSILKDPEGFSRIAAQVFGQARERLSYQPDRIIATSRGTIPVTANGKLQHAALRRALSEGTFQHQASSTASLLVAG